MKKAESLQRLSVCKSRFTLIELLVVIAIIAILAGMLLPALNNARKSGRKADCMGKRKQLGLIIQQYAQDYDDYILPHVTYTAHSLNVYWTYHAPNSSHTGEAISLFKCTEVAQNSSVADSEFNHGTQVYTIAMYHDGIAVDVIDGKRIPRAKIGKFKNGSGKAYVMEIYKSYWHNTGANNADGTSFYGRHNGEGVVLYVDGHVNTRKESYMTAITGDKEPLYSGDKGR